MKYSFNKIVLAAAVVVSLAITSCTKTFDEKIAVTTNLSGNSIVQVYLATVGASRNYVYVDAKPVNGAALATGGLFPASGVGFSLPSGLRAMMVRDTLTATTQTQLAFANNFQPGMGYTVFVYDTINAVKQRTVETKLVVPSDTSCRVRFANFAYNGLAVTPSIDIVSTGKNEIVATNVPYTGVTEFIAHPTALPGEGFQVREAGTMNILATVSSVSLVAKRSYTVIYRGSHRNSTGRSVSIFANY